MKFLSLEYDTFGLDISDLSLKIIKLKKSGKFFNVVSYNQVDIPPGIIQKGIIQNEDALVDIIQSAYKNVIGRKLTTKYVVASLPEERSFLQVIQMPKMSDEELKKAVPFEAENHIPLPVSEVYLDFQIIVPLKNHLNHLDVLMVAMPKKIVNSYLSCLKKAGLIPLVFEVESEAIARALIKEDQSESPIVLVDFGKNSTDFIVFAGRSIQFTYSIPASSDQITQALAKSFNMSEKKAEKVKIGYDLGAISFNAKSKKVFECMEPVLDVLASEIKRYVNFYQDHASHEHLGSEENINKIFLCGGGSGLKGLPEFLSKKLGIPVELKDLWVNVKRSNMEDVTGNRFLSFATAIGLALRTSEDV